MSVGLLLEPRIAVPAAAPAPSPSIAPIASPRPRHAADGPSSFAVLLRGLGREVQAGESVMRGALGATHAGGTLEPEELIALQAGVYRYSEAVDLAAKLIDHATNGLKTVVQGQ